MIRSDQDLDETILEAFSLLRKRDRTWADEDRLKTIGDMIQDYETARMTNAVRAVLEGAVSDN